MVKNRYTKVVKGSRTKGRVVSVVLHALLLLLAFLPFLSMQNPTEPTKEALVIQFDYPYNEYVAPEKFVTESIEPGSQSSGSEAGGSTPSEAPQQTREVAAAPSRLSTPTVTSVSKPSSALRTNMSDIPLPAPRVTQKQAWASVDDSGGVESDGVEELKMIDWSGGQIGEIAGTGNGDDDDSSVWNDGYGSGTGGSGTGSGGGPGNADGPGAGPGGGSGTGGAGSGSGKGIGGVTKGVKGREAFGEGDLSRSLIQRSPRAAQLAVKEGKICVYICVDKHGKVISSQYNSSKSTIKDPNILAKAQGIASEYVFAPDIMANEKQCGNFYFVFAFD